MLPLIFLTTVLTINHCTSIEVTVSQGILSGLKSQSRNGSVYYAFLSVPYAKPPIGKLRFQPPQEADPWDGVRHAKYSPPICIQKDTLVYGVGKTPVMGEEDCLYLNVYTPKLTGNLPVMVWIHGGGLFMGAGRSYGPDYIMDNNVVLVTLNYRLGVLGFLSTGDSVLPGNYGMKDQVAALRWVKKNIASFGGDPNNVMIFGESAGACSVSMHLYSPLSQGLFHKAISQSGTAILPWIYLPRDLSVSRTNTLAAIVGCHFPKNEDVVECLRNVPADELVDVATKMHIYRHYPVVLFGIVTEPEDTEGAFLTKDPVPGEELDSNIPWITGVTSAEGSSEIGRWLDNDGEIIKEVGFNYNRLLPIIFAYCFTAEFEDIPHITECLKTFYFGSRNIGVETHRQFLDLYSDYVFIYNTAKSILAYKGKKYLYIFDYKLPVSWNDVFSKSGNSLGVAHGDDLMMLFKMNDMGVGLPFDVNKLSPRDVKASEELIRMFVHFAYTGDPSLDKNRTWEPTRSNLEYIHISNDGITMKDNFFEGKLDFWNSLPLDKSNKPIQHQHEL